MTEPFVCLLFVCLFILVMAVLRVMMTEPFLCLIVYSSNGSVVANVSVTFPVDLTDTNSSSSSLCDDIQSSLDSSDSIKDVNLEGECIM